MDPQKLILRDMLDPVSNIDLAFERSKIVVNHTQRPAANLNQITAAGSQNSMGPGFHKNHQETPRQDRPKENPNSSIYFLPEHQLFAAEINQHLLPPPCDITMVKFGLGHRGSCACRFSGEFDQRPAVPEIPSHPYVAIYKQFHYVPPHVVDGYDHEKALLIWSTSKLYIEEARSAKANQDKITEATNAEKEKIEMMKKILAETRKSKRAAAVKRARRLKAMGIENRAAERKRRETKETGEAEGDLAVRNKSIAKEYMATMGAKMTTGI